MYSLLDEEFPVSEVHKYRFDKMRSDFDILRDRIIPLLSKELSSVKDLKDFLERCNSELKPELAYATSTDAVMNIIEGKCTIINIELLETIVKRYDIAEARKLITEYNEVVDKFCT